MLEKTINLLRRRRDAEKTFPSLSLIPSLSGRSLMWCILCVSAVKNRFFAKPSMLRFGFAVLVVFLSWNFTYAGQKDESTPGQRGKEIFHEKCAACHGVDGVPILPGTPEFAKGERLEKSDEELLKTIMHGKDQMPPWKETLSKQQCKDVLAFVRGIVGEKVFEEKCMKCHTRGLPSLRPDVPKNSELKDFKGKLDICRGCDLEKEVTREELLGVIRYIRALSDGSAGKK